VLIEELSVLYKESATTGKLMNVGLHPHVSGRAYRIRALREFLRYAKSLDGVWFATREEIADWYLKNHEQHIPSDPQARARSKRAQDSARAKGSTRVEGSRGAKGSKSVKGKRR
jgi:hypothetical protein